MLRRLFILFISVTILLILYPFSSSAAALPGDANGDNKVDGLDYVIWLNNYNKTTNNGISDGDFDNSGKVDGLDYVIWLNNYGSTDPGNKTPTPTQPVGNQPYRAFSADSYWNTPFPDNSPIDPNNAKYIADSQNSSHTQNFLQFTAAPGTSQAFGQPIYWAKASDKLYTITDGSRTVQVHIPANARPASGSDGQITIYDKSTDQVVGMSGASYNSSSDKWTVGGSIDRYILSSNGLDSNAAGSNDSRNTGHRGTTSAVRAVRVDEVQKGIINHRLACFWWATGVQTVNHYWPMVGDEGAKGGIVPEGIVIRIKPNVNLASKGLSQPALVIAKALQDYGCLITDNSGSGNRLKVELNEAAWQQIGLTYDALSPLPWSDWQFVKGGYQP
ncbi:hypothetical protein A2W14_02595 [Candidatus Gottesmanbacteria bacterium RBG_16_37_8]|uniref:Dockerin domain-containing protein n=1 Tax=Candidatus Gottesmanbacteria bacterium RBG_16_37_8 TaxID=1798371 RepID=A0A1F5YQ50_9BACT|nr:MAG: hypothetical protein A2W14_02595 [Candidatus Gottesmanbacteria bacterium RBG_16_37_8]